MENNQGVGERQYNDITPIQQGVEDKSAATTLSGYAGAVSQLTGIAEQQVTAFKQAEQRQNLAQGEAMYEQALTREAEMIKQGVPSSKIAAYRSASEKEVGAYLPFSDRLTMRSKFEKTAYGRSLTQKTPEEVRVSQIQTIAKEKNYDLTTDQGVAAAEAQLYLSTNSMENYVQFSANYQPIFANDMNAILDGPGTPEEKYNLFEQAMTPIRMAAYNIKDPELKAGLLAQYDNQLANYKSAADPTKQATHQESRNRLLQANRTAAMMAATPNNAIVAQEMIKNYGPLAEILIGQLGLAETAKEDYIAKSTALNNLSKGLYNPKDASSSSVVEALGAGAKEVVRTGGNSLPLTQPINTVLEETALRMPKLSTDELYPIMEDLANGGLGELISSGEEVLTPETREAFLEGLERFVPDKIGPIVQGAFEKRANKTGRVGAQDTTVLGDLGDYLDMEIVGGQVVYVGETSDAQRGAKYANEDFSSDLTTIVKAVSIVSGSTMEEALERLKPSLLPEKSLEGPVAPDVQGPVGPQEGTVSVSQEGVSQGTGVAQDEEILVEDELGPMTLKETDDPELNSQIREVATLIDKVEDPSVSYALKRKLASLNSTLAGKSMGGRSGRPKEKQDYSKGPTPFTDEQMSRGSELLQNAKAPSEGGETNIYYGGQTDISLDEQYEKRKVKERADALLENVVMPPETAISKEASLWAEYYNAEHESAKDPQKTLKQKTKEYIEAADIEVLPEVKESATSAFNSGVFDGELRLLGLDKKEAARILADYSKVETSGGKNNTISDGGAGGYFQVVPTTFRSLITEEKIVGPLALDQLGKTEEELLSLSNKEIGEYLRDDSKAAGIFGAAALVSRLMAAKRRGAYD